MKAEIITIGTELLLGEITDTDASFLAGQLPLLGVDLYWISQVGDNRARMLEVLKRAWDRSELIITTGGLGPTDDDLTREVIAELLGEKLAISAFLETGLRERFARWGMEMPLTNLKQAALIPSARSLPNEQGTAPGWWVEKNGRVLVAMPGPPRELQEMWRTEIQPELQHRAESVIVRRTFKTLGLSEAALGEMVSPLLASPNPTLGIYAKADGIHLRLAAKSESREQAEQMIAEGDAKIRNIVADYIWGTDNDTLEMTVGWLLIENGLSLALMEDYSGGWLAASITDVPESPDFFKGGVIAGTDEAKVSLGVKAELISRYGAVSSEVAQAMAEAARELFRADIGIGITGLGLVETGPVEVVYIGISGGQSRVVTSRPRGKRRVTNSVLFELRKLLLQNK
ncbi:competence/damage-inducible protein A [Chloroflexota bacterium]